MMHRIDFLVYKSFGKRVGECKNLFSWTIQITDAIRVGMMANKRNPIIY